MANANGEYYANIGNDFTVALDGSGSYDLDGSIVLYEWDCDGDGIFDWSSSTNGVITHSYTPKEHEAYDVVVTLKVTDDDGLTDTDSSAVHVASFDNDPPIIQLIYPTGGEILSSLVTVKWYAIDDDFPGEINDLPIYLYYTADNGKTWRQINDILPNTGEYEWDTSMLSDGEYKILIEAIDVEGNIAHDHSDYFTVDNGYTGVRVSDVHIKDVSIGSDMWVKNGDLVEITAGITGSYSIEREDLIADLSGLGHGSQVIANSYDGFTATWTIHSVQCTPENGEIIVTVTADGLDSNSDTITADNSEPTASIQKPVNGLYLFNKNFIPFLQRTVIFGTITVEVDAEDTSGINKVEFYIDGELKETLLKGPFDWYMRDRLRGDHELEIIAYDYAGNTATSSTTAKFFNLFG